MACPVYPSDVTDAQWALLAPLAPLAPLALLAPLIPPSTPRGRPRSSAMRRITTGVVSVVRTGCAWRSLPREYGPWQTV